MSAVTSAPARRAVAPAVAVGALTGAVTGVVYAALGWVRFSTGHAGNYDLGIFVQAAQHWASWRRPASAIRGVDSLFADHFSPVTVLFGLGWRVWPDPRALVVVQALALGVCVGMVAAAAATRFAGRRYALPLALGLGFGAGLAKGMVSAASFDVHETTLGTPLMAGLAWALLERRYRPAVSCAAGLLLVKEDLGATVVAAGVVWWLLTRDRRRAVVLVGLGLVGLVVANGVVVAVSPDHTSPYLQFLLGATGNPQGLAGAIVPGGVRWAPAVLFALTAGIVGLRSPLALLALPTLAWRAASSNTSYWQTYFHYDVLLVPIAAFALIEVLSRQTHAGPDREPDPRPDRGRGRSAVADGRSALVAVVVVVGVAWSAGMGIAKIAAWQPWVPGRYVPIAPLQDAAALVGEVPQGAPVVTQQNLGPAVLARVDVRMLASTVTARGGWVLLTPDGSGLGAPEADKRSWLQRQQARPDVRITARGGVVLVRLPGVEDVRL